MYAKVVLKFPVEQILLYMLCLLILQQGKGSKGCQTIFHTGYSSHDISALETFFRIAF